MEEWKKKVARIEKIWRLWQLQYELSLNLREIYEVRYSSHTTISNKKLASYWFLMKRLNKRNQFCGQICIVYKFGKERFWKLWQTLFYCKKCLPQVCSIALFFCSGASWRRKADVIDFDLRRNKETLWQQNTNVVRAFDRSGFVQSILQKICIFQRRRGEVFLDIFYKRILFFR